MSKSSISYIIPVIHEPVDDRPDLYYWNLQVKDAINRLSSAYSDLNGANRAAYGMIYADESTSTVAADIAPTQLIAPSATTGPYRNVGLATTNVTITPHVAGIYSVNLAVSFSGSVNADIHMYLAKNGTSTNIGFHRKLSSTGDIGAASFNGLISCASGDTLSVYVSSAADGKYVLPEDFQFTTTLIDIKE